MTPMIWRVVLVVLMSACGRVGFGGDSVTTDAAVAHNIAFVTSTTYLPTTFGSDLTAVADPACNARAQAAGLPGTYVALLATTGSGATNRIIGSRGWVRTDGEPIVDLPDDLMMDNAVGPVDRDEFGGSGSGIVGEDVITGANADGTPDTTDNCSDYTDASGMFAQGASDWTGSELFRNNGLGVCSDAGPIYCFGVGNNTPLVLPTPGPRYAFVTVGAFLPSATGIGGADQLCQQEAGLAGLSGTFLALLPTTTTAAISRFDLTKPNWVRLDGLAIAPTTLDFKGHAFAVPINLASDKAYIDTRVMTGGVPPAMAAADSTADCSNWTDPTGTFSAGGAASIEDGFNIDAAAESCSPGVPVYCLQQ